METKSKKEIGVLMVCDFCGWGSEFDWSEPKGRFFRTDEGLVLCLACYNGGQRSCPMKKIIHVSKCSIPRQRLVDVKLDDRKLNEYYVIRLGPKNYVRK